MKTRIFGNSARMLVVAFVALLAGCSDDNNISTGAASPAGFNVLLAQTFQHPRCLNCHGFNENNAIGQRHSDLGRSSDCQECHAVDVPTWRAPFESFSFSGLTSTEICEGTKNRSNSDVDFLADHLKNDELILWAIAVAATQGVVFQPAPPGSIAAWRAAIDEWVNNGAICD